MSIVALDAARTAVRTCSPDQLYLLQQDNHINTALKAMGVNLADLTDDERLSLVRYARSLWADYGTYDESKG